MNTSDRIRTFEVLIKILIIAIAGYGFYDINSFKTIYTNHKILIWIISTLLIIITLFVFFFDYLNNQWIKYKNKKNKLSNTVISKRISIIDILDVEGKKAVYFERTYFFKIDKKNPYISDVFADLSNPNSYIENPQLANCTTNFVKKTTHLEISFKDNIERLNDVNSSYEVEKFLYFSVELINSFTNKEKESWSIKIKNYLKEFEQEIRLPAGLEIDGEVKLIKVENEIETIITAVKPIIFRQNNQTIIYLYMTNLDKNEYFELRWKYLV